MNTPNDIRWLMFATIPALGYVDLSTPVTRGILWLWRRAVCVRTEAGSTRPVARIQQ